MATAPEPVVLELNNGDHMTQKEFHRIYEQMPENFRAELIGGIVYVASPLKRRHGKPHLRLSMVFGLYEASTPGVEASDNTTVILGDEGEPQPDLYMRILQTHGGQSGTTPDDYVDGAPELVAEIAASSQAIDLNAKRRDYQRYGVREYIVAIVRERRLRWFDLSAAQELQIADDRIVRSQTFPGLWIDESALFANDCSRLVKTLQQGLATEEHANFAARLQARRS
jgi:Uma2 family endonuclease